MSRKRSGGRSAIEPPAPELVEPRVRTGSLRRRVVLSVLAVLLVVLVSMGAVVNVVLGDRLRSDLRQRVADRALFATALTDQQLTPQQLTDRLTGQGITAAYRSGAEVVVGRDQPPPSGTRPSGLGGQPRLGPYGGPRASGTTAASQAVSVQRVGELLQAQVSVDGGTLTLTANLTDIDRTMSTLLRIELAAGGATVVLAALMLALIVGLALSPLGKMTSLAHRIRGGARGGRLRPTKPHTDLGRTATAFDGMLDALERAEAEAQGAEARMRTFLADASHDLRTPIAGVINTAERLLQDSHSRLERERRLVSLVREAQRAGRLVDDLLLMTRLSATVDDQPRTVQVAPLALRLVIESAVERTASLAGGRRVRAEVADDCWALCDRDAVDRILANLLDNARAATGSDQAISVRAWTEDGGVGGGAGRVVLVEVADTGPGIGAEDAERIFDRFVRLDPARARGADAGGTGLGLPIARALAQAMDGTLSCQPGREGGVFRLTLPGVSAAPPSPLAPAQCRAVGSDAGTISSGRPSATSRHVPV